MARPHRAHVLRQTDAGGECAARRVNIPFSTFALGSFVGLQPLNVISVSAGRTLGRMKSMSDLYSGRTLLTMMACALLALLPAALKQAWRHPRLRGAVRRAPPGSSSAVP